MTFPQLQKESDTLTGRVDDPAVQRPLRQTHPQTVPESLPRDEKRLLPAASCCPECGGALSYLGEDAAEQLELMRSAFRVIRTVREKHACTQCDAIVQAPAPSRPIERGIAGPGLLARVLTSKYAEHTPLYRQSEIYGRWCGAEPLTAVGLGGCMLPAAVTAGRRRFRAMC
jgi:transposase